VTLEITAPDEEWAPTFYYGLQRLGFLFPHPRMQVSPTEAQLRSRCGERFEWRPRLRYRGFHFYTKHPGEWVPGRMPESVSH